jgi:hypothetical protein
MTEDQAGMEVSEVSMQEWAMLAFHAERAPRRVLVTRKSAAESEMVPDGVGGARTAYWVLLAGATAVLVSNLLLF